MRPRPSISLALALCALGPGCSRESAPARAASGPAHEAPKSNGSGVSAAEGAGSLAQQRLHAAAEAFDQGRYDNAMTLLEQLGDTGGLGAHLLRARLALAAGDNIACLRELESARASAPEDVRTYAAAAEIYCALGRLPAAEDEIKKGLERDAESPEMLRARAALLLSRPGNAEQGLALLERALERDPQLDYAHNLHQQALVLAGRARLQTGDAKRALELARRALQAQPADAQARELEAEALAALSLLEEAIARYEQLQRDGQDSGATLAVLHQRAATQCLLEKQRPKAVEHYLRSRELGAGDAELGYGVQVLFEEAVKEVSAGVASFKQEALDDAAQHFARALVLDPKSIEARNHLAVVQYKQGLYAPAAEGWLAVLAQARAERIDLPEPVHLNLARAWLKSGRASDARALLEGYLRDEPDGPWVDKTQAFLLTIDAPAPDESRPAESRATEPPRGPGR